MTEASPLIWQSLRGEHGAWLIATGGPTVYSIRRGGRRGQFVLRVNSQVWSIGFESDLMAEAERLHETGRAEGARLQPPDGTSPEDQRRLYDSVLCRPGYPEDEPGPYEGDPDHDAAAARQHARQTRHIPQED